ncbi:ketoacyl-ACP synthase III [Roseomonas gilardii subsp. gilardii]|uniref:beta-ketoacyl-ACP synthase III n=1 Tax=Roseomonas gilardii TaxID=257708 RepID=UPI001FF885AC|nr:beta-ketoacyl-ACP synthase III [Roseomonas gilardii]UPG71478.1 ketoacyl-ACP synthase III [Roseomonas gilardii subsp. gilardii]
MRAIIAGTGGYLPERALSNEELAQAYGLDTSDEWIRERTGIRRRHIAAAGETASSMGAAAAARALEQAGIAAAEVDAVIVATSTPDSAFPSTAALVQAAIGAPSGIAFDLSAACTGFVYALGMAESLMRGGQARTVLVIGTEVYSRIVDWSDRGTCVLFGDGAGAVVLRASEEEDRGLLSWHLHADGRFADILHVEGGAGSTGGPGLLRMAGREVFRHAVSKLAAVVDEALAANGLDRSAVQWLVPHQANLRIIEAMGKKLGLPRERVVVTVDRHANTSAASIPLALAEATRDGRIARGDLVLMEAIGGGLTWGAALARY